MTHFQLPFNLVYTNILLNTTNAGELPLPWPTSNIGLLPIYHMPPEPQSIHNSKISFRKCNFFKDISNKNYNADFPLSRLFLIVTWIVMIKLVCLNPTTALADGRMYGVCILFRMLLNPHILLYNAVKLYLWKPKISITTKLVELFL